MPFIHYGFLKIQKGIVEYYHILRVTIFISKNAHGIEHLSFNLAIIYKCNLRILTKQKAFMDDLLLFTPSKRAHMAKLEDLLKAFLKNGLKISPKSVSYLKWNCNTWETLYL